MANLRFLRGAREDLESAWCAYEAIQPGLGDKFLSRLARLWEDLQRYPELFGEATPGVRAAMVRNFPYVVYYQANKETVWVIAIRHGQERDHHWKSRRI